MGYWNQHTPYGVDKAILAFVDDISTPWSLTLSRDYLSLDSTDKKALPAGMFVAQVGNTVRFLPRAKVSAAFATGAATGTLSAPYNVFIPGDVLYYPRAYAVITLGGTWTANETITITVGGVSQVITVGSTAIATILTNVVSAIASGVLGTQVEAVSNGATKLYVFANDEVSVPTIAVAEDSGSGTIAIDGSATELAHNNTAIGTILSLNSSTGVVTLSANASAAVPVGAAIGVRTTKIYGVLPHSVDFTDKPTQDIAPVYSCRGVYKGALPYYDSSIAAALPGIPFAERF